MKYKGRKRKLKVSYIILILIICLLLVSSFYAIWQTILTINGIVTGVLVDDKLQVKVVP